MFRSCLTSRSHFCSCEIRLLGGTHEIRQLEDFCFAYLKGETCFPRARAVLSRRLGPWSPDNTRRDPHTTALRKHVLHSPLDSFFCALPRQLLVQINKYVLNAITHVFKINTLALSMAETLHHTQLRGSGVTGFRI